MLIYNTLTQTKSELKPITPNAIKMYVCGQTVYDHCHIGHARSMIVFDMVVRYLRARGYDVTYVRNITDVDDKIIKRANENNETCDALTARFIESMHQDEAALHLLKPTVEPRATETIPEIIALIQTLLDKKIAYVAGNGDVCFAVRRCRDYGKLSKRDIEKLIAGARVDVSEGKNDPLDFVLWKLAKPSEPQWESPWGLGRPGWHIECSAMAESILGQPFDIHGGGMDLKFPHHENEIAQSECAYEKTFSNYWMHAGLLTINGEKMSKSLNNFFTIQEVLEKYPVEVVRYFMLSSHYRSPVNFSADAMDEAKQRLIRFYTALRHLPMTAVTPTLFTEKFHAAMDDDFNSPIAIAVLFDMVTEINRLRETDMAAAAALASELKALSAVFGFLQMDPEMFLQGEVSDEFAKQVDQLIHDRVIARQNKDWAAADRIRDELQVLKVVIEDGASGTSWRKI